MLRLRNGFRTGDHDDELAARHIRICVGAGRKLRERAAIDGFEAFREFARHGRRTLGAEHCGAGPEHRDDPVWRLVEHQRSRLVDQPLERTATGSGLGRQEAFEAEALGR